MVRNWFLWAVCLLLVGTSVGFGQSPLDENLVTRDAFIRSRQKTPPTKQPKSKGRKKTPATLKQPLGLGYSIYSRNAFGRPERVKPDQTFQTGQAIRFVIESNQDGYLYIFNADSAGGLKMIYPNPYLQNGENEILAHVPYQVPSIKEPDPDNQWFYFLTEGPLREELYFVVSRTPQPGIPTGTQLIKYARKEHANAWSPSDQIWQRIELAQQIPLRQSTIDDFGSPQTEGELLAVTREIGLKPQDTPPSAIFMNSTAEAPLLVTRVQLVKR
ncbi:MAG TPA: DUF4384 domain-containing protein [Acidobacteriota bacterium]|nr:DUF4384 domain-containing protein [Acidobacteriota bacterium]